MASRVRNQPGEHGGYGWIPDVPDQRDFLFAPDRPLLKKLAATPTFDLSGSPAMPAIWDQLQLGSCTANAGGACFAVAHRKAGHKAMMPCRLFVYWQSRALEGTTGYDSGASIRDSFKAMAQAGVPPESDWQYDISTFAHPPTAKMKADAVKHKLLTYQAVPQDLTSLKAALLAGYPVDFGFTVYSSFESQEVANTGVVPMPGHGESVLGGHAVCLVGWDDATQRWKVRNSWGNDWGQAGYFTMPYAYTLSRRLASDFWTCSIAS